MAYIGDREDLVKLAYNKYIKFSWPAFRTGFDSDDEIIFCSAFSVFPFTELQWQIKKIDKIWKACCITLQKGDTVYNMHRMDKIGNPEWTFIQECIDNKSKRIIKNWKKRNGL